MRRAVRDRESRRRASKRDACLLNLSVLSVKQKRQRRVEERSCRRGYQQERRREQYRRPAATVSVFQRRYSATASRVGRRIGFSASVRPRQAPASVHRPRAAASRKHARPRRTGPFTLPASSVKMTGQAKLRPNRAAAPAIPRQRSQRREEQPLPPGRWRDRRRRRGGLPTRCRRPQAARAAAVRWAGKGNLPCPWRCRRGRLEEVREPRW